MAHADTQSRVSDLDPSAGTRLAEDVVYGRARLGPGDQVLRATLYLPAPDAVPAPVLVWFEAGAPGGRMRLRRLGRQLTSAGFSLAVPRLRLKTGPGDLAPQTRAGQEMLAAQPVAPGAEALAGSAALAAIEDAARFLVWLGQQDGVLPLAGRPVLGGSGAGAATAFNLACLAPLLGLARPEPAGIFSYSGGFAWPGLYPTGRYPVFAMHNPFDDRVAIGPIRALAEADPDIELIEAWAQPHGALVSHPEEARAVTFDRIRDRLRLWCGAGAG